MAVERLVLKQLVRNSVSLAWFSKRSFETNRLGSKQKAQPVGLVLNQKKGFVLPKKRLRNSVEPSLLVWFRTKPFGLVQNQAKELAALKQKAEKIYFLSLFIWFYQTNKCRAIFIFPIKN